MDQTQGSKEIEILNEDLLKSYVKAGFYTTLDVKTGQHTALTALAAACAPPFNSIQDCQILYPAQKLVEYLNDSPVWGSPQNRANALQEVLVQLPNSNNVYDNNKFLIELTTTALAQISAMVITCVELELKDNVATQVCAESRKQIETVPTFSTSVIIRKKFQKLVLENRTTPEAKLLHGLDIIIKMLSYAVSYAEAYAIEPRSRHEDACVAALSWALDSTDNLLRQINNTNIDKVKRSEIVKSFFSYYMVMALKKSKKETDQ